MWPWSRRRDALTPGAPAPDFDLPDQHGRQHRLADYQGRWLVLYFYPKDDTPGCTVEACAFRDGLQDLQALNAAVLGVSLDDTHSHARFAGKFSLPFPLLADAGGRVARAYGSLLSLGPIKVARRHSFVIDTQGRLARVYREVSPRGHVQQVCEGLRALQAR